MEGTSYKTKYAKTAEQTAVTESLEAAKKLLHNASIILVLLNKEDKENELVAQIVGAQLLATCGTLDTIQNLLRDLDIGMRDVLALSRPVFETLLNAGLVLIDPEAAKAADLHAIQKYERDKNREFGTAIWKASIAGNVPEFQDSGTVKSAVDRFTNKKGKEIRDWIDKSVNEIIDEVTAYDSQAGLLFFGAMGLVYRDSSEVLHGTYYGVHKTAIGFQKDHREILDEIFMQATSTLLFSAVGFLYLLGRKHGLSNIVKNADAALDSLSKILPEQTD